MKSRQGRARARVGLSAWRWTARLREGLLRVARAQGRAAVPTVAWCGKSLRHRDAAGACSAPRREDASSRRARAGCEPAARRTRTVLKKGGKGRS
eukprot:4940737-Pleurochrysis_carterae.AAC.3